MCVRPVHRGLAIHDRRCANTTEVVAFIIRGVMQQQSVIDKPVLLVAWSPEKLLGSFE